ncbi:MAG: DUF3429 domain-containing protein [Hyphomicrobiaceae bacterium]|nr:DUF3429 domain-containing protein [Hyphomicrobiaceae bacterium]
MQTFSKTRTPLAALVWGWAGVIPFVVMTFVLVLADEIWKPKIELVLPLYSAVILTFMGGVHWGIAMVKIHTSLWLYSTGIIPSIFAIISILLPSYYAVLVLISGFIILLATDIYLVSFEALPSWYGNLRIYLTLAVLICLTSAFFHLDSIRF